LRREYARSLRSRRPLARRGCPKPPRRQGACAPEDEREQLARQRRRFEAASRALERALKAQPPEEEPAASYSDLAGVIRYLEAQGYQATKSVYRHRKEGKLKPDADGTYSEATVRRYAKANLRLKASGLKKDDESALRKDELDGVRMELIREQTRLARRKREIEEGKWVPKSGVAQDLAMRAVMLKTGLKQLVASSVSDWIHLVGGDPRRAPELLRAMLEGHERLLADYARADNVVLVIEPPARDAGPDEPAAAEGEAES